MRRALVILVLAVGMASCASTAGSAAAPQWLVPIHRATLDDPTSVAKYCDTETGNLVYLYGDFRGGIAVVPGGCR